MLAHSRYELAQLGASHRSHVQISNDTVFGYKTQFFLLALPEFVCHVFVRLPIRLLLCLSVSVCLSFCKIFVSLLYSFSFILANKHRPCS